MFRERMKIAVKKIGLGLINLSLALLLLGALLGIVWLAIKYPIIDRIIMYTLYTIIGLPALYVLISLLFKVYTFLKWLFIDPYKEKNKMKS